MDLIAEFFRQLVEDYPRWNFIWMYEPVQQEKVLSGIWMTIQLSIACLFFSVIIGIIGAFLQGSRSALIRMVVQGYIQFFRNTPPYVQLLFFYFALGQFTPTYSPDGWLEVPIISNVGWAIISLSFFAGAGKHARSSLISGIFACADIPLYRISACGAGVVAGAQ
jgi:polar amino acid transport system permease protein